jgi:hypothetical protein
MAKPITPEQLAACGTEHGHQCALFCWAALCGNDDVRQQLRMMFAIPNGGQRGDGTKRGAAIAGGKLKAEGVKDGVPDIMLPVAICLPNQGMPCKYHGLFIELKRPKSVGKRKGVERENQSDFARKLEENGYRCVVCYGWEDARDMILKYLHGTIDS